MNDLGPLTIQNLACRRGDRLLFKDISFSLQPADLLWLRGPNGSGKSSLMRSLIGLLKPIAGQVLADGESVHTDRRWWAAQFHYLAHTNGVKESLSVSQQLDLYARAWRCAPGRVDAALEKLGLTRQRALPIRVLSAGQKRRLGLCRLLLASRPVWFLDEPATALDVSGTALLDSLMSEHQQQGGRTMVISHQPVPSATAELSLGA